jgi:ABC-2 type transport system permease protein
MSFTSATFLFFRTHLTRVVFSRRSLLCLLLAAIPVVVALLVAQFGRKVSPGDLATHVGYFLQLQVVLPVLGLIAGSAAVAEEVEDRTITFLVSRPIPRASLLFGRWCAILVYLSCVLALSTAAMLAAAAGARGAGLPLGADIQGPLLGAVLVGGVVYSAIFASLGVFTRHPVIVGLAYAFAIEGFVANLPTSTQAITIQFYLRSVIAAGGSSGWRSLEGFDGIALTTLGGALTRLAGVLVLALALGAWRMSRREFVLSS